MSRFIDARLGNIDEYVPGEQPRDMQYIKLNTNEFPYPPSPEVRASVDDGAMANLRLYPDPECMPLRRNLAAQYGVAPENIYIGNGSDEVLNFAFMAYGGAGMLFPDISYGFYPVFGDLYDIDYTEVPLKDDLSVEPKDYMSCGKTVVLANPNAPTGLSLSVATVEEIVRSNPDHVVVIDEAYVDFGGESVIPLTKKYNNLLVVGTFSKSRALAGARIGFAVADSALIRDLYLIKDTTNSYNVNRLSMAAALAALDSQVYFDEKCAEIIKTREKTAEALRKMGFFVTESKANFLFARSDKIDGGTLYEKLKARGILVRHFSKERIKDYVRITVGTPKEMDALIGEIQKILDGETL